MVDIDALVLKYKYSKLPTELSKQVRGEYRQSLPKLLKEKGNREHTLYTLSGTKISSGYERIVIGDYGAYIEIAPKQMVLKNIQIQKGQEYRLEPRYRNVKYIWYTAKDDSCIKIYHQKEYVVYADYKPSFYYVSPAEVFIPTKIFVIDESKTDSIDDYSEYYIVDIRQKPYGKLNYTNLIRYDNYTWCKELCLLNGEVINANHGLTLLRQHISRYINIALLGKINDAFHVARLLFNDDQIICL